MELKDLLELAGGLVGLGGALGVGRLAVRWLRIGRRAKVASIVAQLAQEVLVAWMRRKGAPAAAVSQMDEAIEALRRKLEAIGVDPRKSAEIARDALAGARADDAEEVRAASRRVLLGEEPKP